VKILFLHNGAGNYGADKSLSRLVRRLAKDGHRVTVILPRLGPLKTALENSGHRVLVRVHLGIIERQSFVSIRTKACFAMSAILSILRLALDVRKIRPDIIHTNVSVIFSGGIVARLAHVKHVWHIRETYVEFPRLWRHYQRVICALADQIVCVSESGAQQFAEWRRNKVIVINNGVPEQDCKYPSPDCIDTFRRKYGLSNRLVVGVVGRIKLIRKGQEVFIRAAEVLHHRHPEAKYLIVGSPHPGDERHLEVVKQLVAAAGLESSVVFTGEVEDANVAVATMDVFVLPSGLPEPFGGVVIEAMAMGKPVVGTRIGGTVDQIVDGHTGYLVDPNDHVSMADAVDRILGDPQLRERMGRAARERFLKHFEHEIVYEKISRMYERVICGFDGLKG